MTKPTAFTIIEEYPSQAGSNQENPLSTINSVNTQVIQHEKDKINRFIKKYIPESLRTAISFSESALEYGLSPLTTITMFGAVFNKRMPIAVYPAVIFTTGNIGGILKTDAPFFRKLGVSKKKLKYINAINTEASHILGRYNALQELAFHISGLIIIGSWDFEEHPYRKLAFAGTIAMPIAVAIFTGFEKIYLLKNNIAILNNKDERSPLIISSDNIVKAHSDTKIPSFIYTALYAGCSAYQLSALPILIGGFKGYHDEVALATSNYGRYGRLGIGGSAAILIGILDYYMQHLEKHNSSAKTYRNAIGIAIRVAMYLALMLDFSFDFNYSVKQGDRISYPVGTAVTIGIMLLMAYLNKPTPAQIISENHEESNSSSNDNSSNSNEDIENNSNNNSEITAWSQKKAEERSNQKYGPLLENGDFYSTISKNNHKNNNSNNNNNAPSINNNQSKSPNSETLKCTKT